MKTLQLISTAVLLGLTSVSFSHDKDKENNTTNLSITILNITSPSCNGGDNGSALIAAKGGEGPYTYDWNTFPNQKTAHATNLKSGTYFVEVTDANGQVIFEPVYISDPNASIIAEQVSAEDEVNLTATVTGSNAPYTYELNGKPATADLMQKLPVGIHKLVIKDNNQCEMLQYIQVFEMQGEEKITKEKQQIKSKNDRKVEASNLIPTVIIDDSGNRENLVVVSNH